MVLVRRRWSVFVLAVLAGLSHPEQALFMVAAAGAVRIPMGRIPYARNPGERTAVGESTAYGAESTAYGAVTLAIGLGGVVTGRLLTEVYFRISGIEVLNPRTGYLDFGLSSFMEHHTQEPLSLLWTLWGPIWLVFAAAGVAAGVNRWMRRGAPAADPGPEERGPATDPARGRLWLAIALLGAAALLPVVVTLDETRVYAVVTAPLLAAIATVVGTWDEFADRWIAVASAALLAFTAVVPGGFATGVTAWRTQLPTREMVDFLVSGDQPSNSPSDMTLWLLEPFTFEIPDVDG
jgi:hypothetical protein